MSDEKGYRIDGAKGEPSAVWNPYRRPVSRWTPKGMRIRDPGPSASRSCFGYSSTPSTWYAASKPWPKARTSRPVTASAENSQK
jgi:hypothetical protein